MKNNVKNFGHSFRSLLAFGLLLALFQACDEKKSDPAPPASDRTRLKARLDSATALYATATEGKATGQYTTGSKFIYQRTLDGATTNYNDATATQTTVNNTYANLGDAMTVFSNAQVAQIAPQNLVLYYRFDAGSLTDLSGRQNTGTLKAGSELWGAGMPATAPDQFGNANGAYFFDKGGNIEIPYSPSLNPGKEITISLWENATASRPSNYLMALNRWNGYKIQLQRANKVFFTVKTDQGIWDKDNETVTLDTLNRWHHVAVTYKSGEMTFYIDGALIKTWTDKTGDPTTVKNTINMTIGQDLPTNLYRNDIKDDADGNNFNGPWGGYFTGSMDNIRVYNAALSAAQIGSIYTSEKSQ